MPFLLHVLLADVGLIDPLSKKSIFAQVCTYVSIFGAYYYGFFIEKGKNNLFLYLYLYLIITTCGLYILSEAIYLFWMGHSQGIQYLALAGAFSFHHSVRVVTSFPDLTRLHRSQRWCGNLLDDQLQSGIVQDAHASLWSSGVVVPPLRRSHALHFRVRHSSIRLPFFLCDRLVCSFYMRNHCPAAQKEAETTRCICFRKPVPPSHDDEERIDSRFLEGTHDTELAPIYVSRK